MKKLILLLMISVSCNMSFSQDLLMQNGTFNQCSGTFYDSGGVAGNYADGESFTTTICPDGPDQFIQLAFSLFSTQQTNDVVTFYDGVVQTILVQSLRLTQAQQVVLL